MSDAALEEGPDILLRYCLTLLQPDPGTQLFPVVIVRHTKDLCICNRGKMVKDILDLDRIDVLPAADRHVFAAADDVTVALGIERPEITRVHPAFAVDRLSGLPFVI